MAHPVENKLRAAVAWLITGSISEAAKLADIPERTLRYWMDQPSWDHILNNAKSVKDQELDATWTSLIHRCADQLNDRVAYGEKRLVKIKVKRTDGSIEESYVEKRVPLCAKDLTVIMAIATDKRAITRKNVPKPLDRPRGTDLGELGADLESAGAEITDVEDGNLNS